MSAAKLRMMNKDVDFLQGRADGPNTVFAGTYCKATPSSEATIWEGWIRHKKDTFRYGAFVAGSSSASFQYFDDDGGWDSAATCDFGEDTGKWIEIGTCIDISAASTVNLTTGSWYRVRAAVDGTGGSIIVAMLEETCAIEGWLEPPTFVSLTSDLAGSLNTLRDSLNALKTNSDAPFGAFGGMTTPINDSTACDVWYKDDSGETAPNYDNCYFAGGFYYPAWPAGSAFLKYVMEPESGSMSASFWANSGEELWGVAGAGASGTFSCSEGGVYEGTINVTGAAETAGCLCRLRVMIEADPTACGADEFNMLYLSIYADETDQIETCRLKYWQSGCHINFADLNMTGSRMALLTCPAKLDFWRNSAIKRVGFLLGTDDHKDGFRIGLHRRRGFPILHYRSTCGQQSAHLRYPNPEENDWYHQSLERTDLGTWQTLDLAQVRGLYEGMYYNADDVQVAQEWDEGLNA
jgi:hypothetical protein